MYISPSRFGTSLEPVTFSAIKATTFPLLHFLSPYLSAKSFLLMESPWDLARCCSRSLARVAAPFCESKSSISDELGCPWHTDLLIEQGTPDGRCRKFLSLWWTLLRATCDRAPQVSWQATKLLLLVRRADRARTSCSAFWGSEGCGLQAGKAVSEDWGQHPDGLLEQ